MKVPMGPPPLPTSNPSSSCDTEPNSPPPPPPPDEPLPEAPSSSDEPAAPLPDSDNERPENTNEAPKSNANAGVPRSRSKSARSQVPYTIPEWSESPDQPFFFEVLKEGSIVEKLDVSKKGAYMFGRSELCDFVLEHPTLSRFHAVLQFRGGAEVFLFDLGSTHGTFINKSQIGKKEYTEIHVGDVIKFGMSTRLYILQGPSDLMPPEGDLNKIREAKAAREEMRDREESLARARREASLAEGISWGMAEDAIEETPDVDVDEITWQTYKGLLTERQEKTKSKIVKRIEKVAHMKKEIDAIRAKDISQGGLTQGQQTQIARNELRITQLMEELENLEETLNDSIRESVGARTGKGTHGKKKGAFEEEDDGVISDDDDFYDRTKKKKKSSNGEQQTVETADSLLDKRDLIINEMDMKRKSLESEKNRLASTGGSKNEDGDDLDAYMTGLSSQLVHEKVTQFEKELADLQVELEKITYLLKIADPMGDAAKKRELTKSSQPAPSEKGPFKEPQKPTAPKTFKEPKKPASTTQFKEPKRPDVTPVKESKEPSNLVKEEPVNPPKEIEHEEKEKPKFVLPKPQWLGAVKISTESEANEVQLESTETEETDGFVDYKDRKGILLPQSGINEIEAAKPGLIVRKRKEPVSSEDSGSGNKDTKAPKTEPESSVADAVALLLKHERGYQALDELEDGGKMEHKSKKEKRVLGPSRPDFLESTDYETWVPPEGQTGDGRTKLNDRFGY